jgi:hypothetical protein
MYWKLFVWIGYNGVKVVDVVVAVPLFNIVIALNLTMDPGGNSIFTVGSFFVMGGEVEYWSSESSVKSMIEGFGGIVLDTLGFLFGSSSVGADATHFDLFFVFVTRGVRSEFSSPLAVDSVDATLLEHFDLIYSPILVIAFIVCFNYPKIK